MLFSKILNVFQSKKHLNQASNVIRKTNNVSYGMIKKKRMISKVFIMPLMGTICLGFTLISHGCQIIASTKLTIQSLLIFELSNLLKLYKKGFYTTCFSLIYRETVVLWRCSGFDLSSVILALSLDVQHTAGAMQGP